MPLGPGVKYRYKKGTKIRLAFKRGKVVEAKNMQTGDVSTPADHQDLAGYKKAHYKRMKRSGI